MSDGLIRTIDTYAWVEEEQGVSYWLAVERSGTGQRKKNRDGTFVTYWCDRAGWQGTNRAQPVMPKVSIGPTA